LLKNGCYFMSFLKIALDWSLTFYIYHYR
jgi:hypothetical protein